MLSTFAAAGGRTLSYTRRGSGPLVVCMPGGPGMDPVAYFSAMELPGHELLIFAPRGTGDSTPPATPRGYGMAGYVEDLESLRLHLSLERLTLYGNSHGGCVALAYAGRHPDRVERLVIVNAPPRIDEAYVAAAAEVGGRFAQASPDGAQRVAAAEAAWAAIESDISEAERQRQFRVFMARYVARQGPAETEYLDELCSAAMNYDSVGPMYAEFENGLDLLVDAATVTAPALVVGSELDAVVPAAAMRWIAEAIPDSRYVELPGVGHFPEVEAAERFTASVCDFLDG